MKRKPCIIDIKKIPEKIMKTNHLSTLTFVIYRHPVMLFTRNAD